MNFQIFHITLMKSQDSISFNEDNSIDLNSSERTCSFISEDLTLSNSSLNEYITTKHDLLAKLEAAKMTQQQYTARKIELENQIQQINDKACITLKILDEKKDSLIMENDKLQEILDDIGTVEYLDNQLTILEDIQNNWEEHRLNTSFSLNDFVEIGVINEYETIEDLERKLKQISKELNQIGKKGSFVRALPVSFDYFDNMESEKEMLKRKIRLLEQTYETIIIKAENEMQIIEEDIEKNRKLLEEQIEKVNSNS